MPSRPLLPAAALLVLTLLTYLPLSRAGFIWDDDDHVTENPNLRSVHGLRRIWTDLGAVPQYYPLTHTTFWLEYRLWGKNPLGYHAVNVLLHAASAILLWRILLRLRLPGAWVAAAVFAVHPANVESVAWITETKNTQSLLFYLLTTYTYLRFLNWPCIDANAGASVGEASAADYPLIAIQSRRSHWLLVAFFFFICALCSKTVASTWPAAMLVLIWWRTARIAWKDAVLLVPFLAVAFSFSRITKSMEIWNVGAHGPDWDFSFPQRLLTAGRAVYWYLHTVVFPVNLSFIYPRWKIDPSATWQWLFPVAVAGGLLLLFILHKKIGRGPFTAAALFIGTLTPALGFFNLYPMQFSFVADHFMYHASIAAIVGITAFTCIALNKCKSAVAPSHYNPDSVPSVFSVVHLLPTSLILLLAILTANQSTIYKDLPTLWTNVLSKNPDAWVAETNLSAALLHRGYPNEAERHARRAVELAPTKTAPLNILGEVLLTQHQPDDAIPLLRKSLSVDPHSAVARDNLALALRDKNDLDSAIYHHLLAIAIRPDYVNARVNLANAYLSKGDIPSAKGEYLNAVQIDPNRPALRNGLGIVYATEGRLLEAAVEFRKAVELDPTQPESHNNLGKAYEKLGQPRNAQREYAEAARLRGNPGR